MYILVAEKATADKKANDEKVAREQAEAKAKKANTHLQTKVVTKIVKIHDKAALVKGQIQQNKQAINADCRLNEAAINAYNRNIVKEKK